MALLLTHVCGAQKDRREREGKAEDLKAMLKDREDLELMIKEQDARKALVNDVNDQISRDPQASKAIRGSSGGYWLIKPLAPAVCHVTYLGQAELGGNLPTALLDARILTTLSGTVQPMQVKFKRNGKIVDKEMRDAFLKPPALAELSREQRTVVEVCKRLEGEKGGGWETLASPSPFVNMWIKHAPVDEGGRSIVLGKATAVIDCPAHAALEFMFAYTSRERMRISSEEGNPARLLQRANTPHDQVVATIKKMAFPLSNREFVGRFVCAADTNGDLLFTAVPVDDVVDYGMSTRTVRGVDRALMRVTPSGESQCKVTYIQYLDAGGAIPAKVSELKIPVALSAIGEMRDEFQRDDEIDKLERDELARVMKAEQQVYSEDEDSLIQRVQDKLGAFTEEHEEAPTELEEGRAEFQRERGL